MAPPSTLASAAIHSYLGHVDPAALQSKTCNTVRKVFIPGSGIWLPALCLLWTFTATHPASAVKLSISGVSECNCSNKGCMRPFWYLGLTRARSNLATSQPPHQAMYMVRKFAVPGNTIKSLLDLLPIHCYLLLCLRLWFCSLWFLAECCSPLKCWALTYPASFLFWLWVTCKQCGEAS